VLDVNLTGTFRTCMAFRPLLAKAKGSIVNICLDECYAGAAAHSRLLRQQGRRRDADQGARHGLGRGRHYRVNAVAPGYIETSINAAGRSDAAHYQRIADRTAFKRWDSRKTWPARVAFLCMPRRTMRLERWSRSTVASRRIGPPRRKFTASRFLPRRRSGGRIAIA